MTFLKKDNLIVLGKFSYYFFNKKIIAFTYKKMDCKSPTISLVFCYQNCSDLLWEKIVIVIEKKLLKFEAESWEFSKFLRSLEQLMQAVKGQKNFW